MISLNQDMHLGRTAFFLMLSKRVFPGLVLFAVALIAGIMQTFILQSLAQTFKNADAGMQSSIQNFPVYFSYGLNGLFAVSIILMLAGLIVCWLEYRNYSFRFEEFNLIVKRGVFSTEEVSIPYRQMQDININRSLAHIMLGVSRLIIDSAGHEEAEEHNETDIILEPLDKGVAEDIRSFLDRRIGVQIVKDVKEEDRDDEASLASAKSIT